MGYLKKIIKSFSRNERIVFASAFLAFFISSLFLISSFFSANTSLVAVAGGKYAEGAVGQPIFVNPIFSGSNEADQDLVELIFGSLGEMAESYKVSADGKTWLVRLKEGIRWDDGRQITSDDVIFTIGIIQNADSRSPLYPMWQKVNPERISELEFRLDLPEVYSFFQNTLDEFRPIPKHIFAGIPAENLRLSEYNLEPVGSGPFKFSSMSTHRSGFIAEYRLARNNDFFGDRAYLDNFIFKFYENEKELMKAFNSGSIDGFGGLRAMDLAEIKISHQLFEMRMPRYYAVFFNTSAHPALKEKNVRLALNYATDKSGIIQDVFGGKALSVDGPLIPGMSGYDPDVYPQEGFSTEKANSILDNGGWVIEEDGVRAKTMNSGKVRLEFDLVVPAISFLTESARIISENWAKIGVKANVIEYSVEKINEDAIRTRNYQMILFGNIFSNNGVPDLSSFWHSSERFYPGLNLALYENRTADSLIESIREATDSNRKQSSLSSLQSLIVQDSPGVFLFSPNYFYVSKNSLGGFNERFITLASKRFQNISAWHTKTARTFE